MKLKGKGWIFLLGGLALASLALASESKSNEEGEIVFEGEAQGVKFRVKKISHAREPFVGQILDAEGIYQEVVRADTADKARLLTLERIAQG